MPSDLLLRPYRPADASAATEIYAHYVRETVITFETEPPTAEQMGARFAAVIARGHPLLIAELGSRLVGYGYASTYRDRYAYRFTCENSIYFAPDVLGRGLGGQMLGALISASRQAGLRQMIAVITAERANSIRLHERHGFRLAGHYEAVGYKFDRWLDIVHMQRPL